MKCNISPERIDQTIAFHGHSCPGLAIGIRAAELAYHLLGDPADGEFVAVSETDMCGVDAIQFLTGCTYGKGNFIHRDYGKKAFSFFDRKAGKGFRAVLTDNAKPVPDQDKRAAMLEYFMTADLDELFSISWLDCPPPRPAQILESLVCDHCGETTMESRTRRYAGKTCCIPCFDKVEQKI
ncbi:FmdE family protein [Pseudodesulfovibrio sp. zrk46]|uniref:FmdE family protein n=1 Tax=Pseudodesulfovibrio sp. zrk46 TaxID=2725288 RepID=UPI001448EEF8|nr:FmdE family protein [Pseudodesulfovibrio sp. zrk46]QJB56697.1 formylmethanofuran dehydrogenase [Pseudodesulfovibrio sp. zrk46]